jgi:DHA1 family tetracycline resistance protein-like MFS transporter
MTSDPPATAAPTTAPGRSPALVIFMTVTLDLIGFGIVIPFMPLYAQSFGASGRLIGLLFASYSAMQFLFAPVWGAVSDRIGRRPVLLGSIAVSAGALVAFAFAPSFWWLLGARVVAGMGTANLAVATAYIADITKAEDRARGMGMIGAAFGIGFILGPFIGGELGRHGYTLPSLVAAGLSALNFVLASLLLPESLPPERRGARPARGLRARFALLDEIRELPRVVSLVFLNTAAFSMLEVAFVLFSKQRLGFDAVHNGRVFAFIGVIAAVIQGGLIGRLTMLAGEKRLLRTGLFLMAAGLALVPVTPHDGWGVLLVVMAVVSIGSGLTNPSLQSLVSRTAGPEQQGLALGLSQSASALARVVGPITAGFLYDLGTENTPFLAGGALMLLGWVLALWLLAPLAVGRVPSRAAGA